MDDKARSAGDASPAGSQAALLEDAGDATEPLTPADRVISITRPAETPSSLSDCPTPTQTQSQTPRCASPRSSSHAALLEDVAPPEREKEDNTVAILCAAGAAVGALVFGYSLGFSSPALPGMLGRQFKHVRCDANGASAAAASLSSSCAASLSSFGS